MELNHLKYFYQVVREGGFTNASRKLRVAQPSVSKMVQLLEEQIGAPLLKRTSRSIQLTQTGEVVFAHCEKIFGEIDKLLSSVDESTNICRGPLTFAAADPIATYLLPEVIAQFKREHPESVPAFISAPARPLLKALMNGKLEFGLFFHVPDAPPSLKVKRLRRIPFHLVISAKYAHEAKIRASFIGSREIDDTGTRRFPTIERIRRQESADDPKVKIQISTNQLTAHLGLVLAGAGVAILPEFMVIDHLQSGRLTKLLPKEKFEFDLKLVTRKNAALSLNARVFLEIFEQAMRTESRKA